MRLLAFHITAAVALLVTLAARAGSYVSNAPGVTDLRVENTENRLIVSFNLCLDSMRVGSDREVSLIPVLTQGDSVYTMPRLIVAGRNRYIQNLRKHKPAPGERLLRPGVTVAYEAVIPFSGWMQGAVLSLAEDWCECGFDIAETRRTDLTVISRDMFNLSGPEFHRSDALEIVFSPMWAYVSPSVEARKSRTAKGSACIDFKTNRTEIDPSYRRNPIELRAIQDTIDIIKNDPDSRIDRITITGHASPEGPFANNMRLAKGRTEALAGYVRALYALSDSILRTAWVAEDWDGLVRFVEQSQIESRDAILKLIADTDIAPDERERRLKKAFPAQYRLLLDSVFPGLRRSDYTVEYEVSAFSDPAKIARVLKEDPRKISLHELYVLAQSLPAGSDEFREVFEVAVRLFPSDSVANLNAGITALSYGSTANAAQYLEKAGHSAEAVYARGILAAMSEDYAEAAELFKQASGMGLETQASDALRQLRAMGKTDGE